MKNKLTVTINGTPFTAFETDEDEVTMKWELNDTNGPSAVDFTDLESGNKVELRFHKNEES